MRRYFIVRPVVLQTKIANKRDLYYIVVTQSMLKRLRISLARSTILSQIISHLNFVIKKKDQFIENSDIMRYRIYVVSGLLHAKK